MAENVQVAATDWVIARLADVCMPTRQWNPDREPRDWIEYVDVSAVSRESLSVTSPARNAGASAPSRARKIVAAGDVLFATVRPRLRRIARIDQTLDGEIASTAFCVLRPRTDLVNSEYLYFAVQRSEFVDAVAQHESGASYPAVRDSHVLQAGIPLPSIEEQRAIAAVLMACKRALDTERDLAAKTSELKQAVMKELFSHGLRDVEVQDTPFGSLPVTWQTTALGDCSIVQSGVTKGRTIDPGEAVEVPYLRVANVQDGRLDLREIKTIQLRRSEVEQYLLQDGDVLLTEGGDFDKLGRGFIWRGEVPNCVHQNHVFAVRADRSVLFPEFLAYLVQSPYGKTYFLTVAHKTTNLASINSTKLKALPVPLPALDEQREIVAILSTIDRKLDLHERKRALLTALFDTLLDDLMTGRRRVAELASDAAITVA